jgi:hypothetical protein
MMDGEATASIDGSAGSGSSASLPHPADSCVDYDSDIMVGSWTTVVDAYVQIDTDVPSLESVLDAQVFRHLKPKERRRQDLVNGAAAQWL